MTLFDSAREPRPLRPHQVSGLQMLRQATSEEKRKIADRPVRIIFAAPCSYGKTLTAAHMFTSAIGRGLRCLFCVPAITLVAQAVRDFQAEGLTSIGVIQGNHSMTNPYASLQVASVQTLLRRKVPDVDLIVIDEAHLQFKGMYDLLDSEEWRNKIVIGLTGTPGAKGMGKHWHALVVPATLSSLMTDGWMSPYIAYAPADEYEPDMTQVRTVAGEFDEAQTAKVMSDSKLVGHVVDHWLAKTYGKRTFLYGVDCAHAQLLQAQFLEQGLAWGYIDGSTDLDDRTEIFRQLRDREIHGIASVATLIVGVDEKVECIIDAAPTKSRMRQGQKIPRMLRLDKDDPLKVATLLDHAGNCTRLGLVQDFIWDTLDDGKPKDKAAAKDKEKEAPLPRKCPSCGRMIPAKQRLCACGWQPERVSDIEHAPGILVEFGSGKKGAAGKNKVSQAEKQQFYAELLGYAEMHGKKPGSAYYRYKDKFGVFPQGKPDPQMPSAATERWIKAQQIRYIKGKQAGEKRASNQPWAGVMA